MRVRIIKQGEGVVDGVSLRHLVPEGMYDVDGPLARYLTTNGLAEEVSESNPALVTPLDTPYALEQLTRGVTVLSPRGVVVLEKRRRRSDRRQMSRSDRRRTT